MSPASCHPQQASITQRRRRRGLPDTSVRAAKGTGVPSACLPRGSSRRQRDLPRPPRRGDARARVPEAGVPRWVCVRVPAGAKSTVRLWYQAGWQPWPPAWSPSPPVGSHLPGMPPAPGTCCSEPRSASLPSSPASPRWCQAGHPLPPAAAPSAAAPLLERGLSDARPAPLSLRYPQSSSPCRVSWSREFAACPQHPLLLRCLPAVGRSPPGAFGWGAPGISPGLIAASSSSSSPQALPGSSQELLHFLLQAGASRAVPAETSAAHPEAGQRQSSCQASNPPRHPGGRVGQPGVHQHLSRRRDRPRSSPVPPDSRDAAAAGARTPLAQSYSRRTLGAITPPA